VTRNGAVQQNLLDAAVGVSILRALSNPLWSAIMAENKTTTLQAQQIPGVDQWKKMMDDQNARFATMLDEVSKAHAKWIEYGNTQIDEMSELMKTQFNYVNELATGARKLSVESSKKAMEFFVR